MEFWKTEEGKRVGILTHDVANSTSVIGTYLRLMERCLEKGNLEDFPAYLERSKNALKRIDEAVDTYYTKVKDEHTKNTPLL